jgi:uncharacterized membrane protein YhaH (DUF805 family)
MFMKLYLRAYLKALSWQGRASRAEYWAFTAPTIAIVTAAGLAAPGQAGPDTARALLMVFAFPWLSVTARRLHDLGKSGDSAIIGLLPVFGWLYMAYICSKPGMAGDNKYGPPPGVARGPEPSL